LKRLCSGGYTIPPVIAGQADNGGSASQQRFIRMQVATTPTSTMTDPTILFVCTGNTCRSPMAEHLFRARMGLASGWRAASAGVAASEGRPASEEAVLALRERGVDLTPHRSRGLTRAIAESATLIVALSEGHAHEITRSWPHLRDRVRLLTSFGVTAEPTDVPDPIGQSLFTYRKVRDTIESALADLILHLRTERTPAPSTATGETTLKIVIGADHGGYELKEFIRPLLAERGLQVEDVGCSSTESVDYPDYAAEVADRVSDGRADQGIIICTSGIGVSMAANKFPGVRAALCLKIWSSSPPRTTPAAPCARPQGSRADQQVRRGLSRQALVQRLRTSWTRRAPRHRAREALFGAEHANVQPHCGSAPTWRSISPCSSPATRSWP
jgi:ribose 5-phosphate isomerase B